MDNVKQLSTIIVNYKTPTLTQKCINNIAKHQTLGIEMIVVDNASHDGSRDIILEGFFDVKWIQNHSNEGFGRANNKGVTAAISEFVLLLNSDVIVSFESIEKCLNEIQERQKVGVLGCNLLNEDGTPQKSTYSIASFRKLLDQNLIINKLWPMGEEPVEGVMGSFMLIPKKVFEEVGGFDPDFFMYSEELDLCHRIAQKGYTVEYFEGATAIHKNGGSTTNKEWSMKQRYLSNALLFLKVRGYSGYLFYHLLFLFNTFTNFFAMWWLDSLWRNSYWKEQRYYFSNFANYFKIPILFSTSLGKGKRMLVYK